jgi:hypothetical protein
MIEIDMALSENQLCSQRDRNIPVRSEAGTI